MRFGSLFAGLAALAGARGVVATCESGENTPQDDVPGPNDEDLFRTYPSMVRARQAGGPDLRILPLGASIMSGVGSPEHSGMRKWVRMGLRNDGWNVNMVGTQRDGTDMKDGDHEAQSGAVLLGIQDNLQKSLKFRPNIVMINGGTNNANLPKDVDKVYDQMRGILEDIWEADGMENTCIILSTLLPTSHPTGKKNRLLINDDYRKIVKEYEDKKCIYLADMEPEGKGADFISIDKPYWDDTPKVHPNNEGHKRMAYVFYAAIHQALKDEKVVEPALLEGEDDCDKELGDGTSAGQTQKGFGEHDGIYYHSSVKKGVILEIENEKDEAQWRFARLFSRDYDDLLKVGLSEDEHRFGVWKNSADGKGNFEKIEDLETNLPCNSTGLHFVDMNADGLDDCVCVSPSGDLHMSLNEGNGSGDKLPTFKHIGLVKESEGAQALVRLADIDGDGRADYGVVSPGSGDVSFWRNGWVDKAKWEELGVRVKIEAPSEGSENFPEIRFEDVNGDGRDDWMFMDMTGGTTTHTNARSCLVGKEGDGLNVAWRQGFQKGKDSGPTHEGIDEFQKDGEDLRDRIHFARIYGTKPAFGNLGVQDYVFMEAVENDDMFTFKMHVWENSGSGSTKLAADGNKYCNMMGHNPGYEDYVWVSSTGAMTLFPNLGKKSVQGSESFWGPQTDIWTPASELDRRDLHLVDWDNSGVCDIVWVDPSSGNVRVWANEYPTTKSWDTAFHEVAAPELACAEKPGTGIHDLAVRFADITGNGRPDYLCIATDGSVSGALQDENGAFKQVDNIMAADDMERADMRLGDVNGDGLADLIWVNKFTGDGDVMYNRGRSGDGSSFSWDDRKTVYDGKQAGTCIFYPDLDGNGRADQHSLRGTFTNEADTTLNTCGLEDTKGDDPEGVVDPELPVQPGNPVE